MRAPRAAPPRAVGCGEFRPEQQTAGRNPQRFPRRHLRPVPAALRAARTHHPVEQEHHQTEPGARMAMLPAMRSLLGAGD